MGKWITEAGDAQVEIYQQGDKVNGKIDRKPAAVKKRRRFFLAVSITQREIARHILKHAFDIPGIDAVVSVAMVPENGQKHRGNGYYYYYYYSNNTKGRRRRSGSGKKGGAS